MAKNYALLGKLAVTSIEFGDDDEITTSTARRSSRQQAARDEEAKRLSATMSEDEEAKRLSAAMSEDEEEDSAPVDPALLAGLTFCSDADGSEDDWVDDQAFLPIAPAKANWATWPVSRPTPIKK